MRFGCLEVGTVHVAGMVISIPPREMRAKGAKRERKGGTMKIHVKEIDFDDSHLIVATAKLNKVNLPNIFLRAGGAFPRRV